MKIRKVLIVGSGTMGTGIGLLCAQNGIEVIITDASLELAEKGYLRIDKGLSKRVEKEKISNAQKDEILSRISVSGDLSSSGDVDIVIESVSENLELKKKIFAKLDTIAPSDTIFATNTTSLSISSMATVTKRPDKVVQIHFFNPAFIMKLVEIMPGEKTSRETLKVAEQFALQLGKDPVVCKREAPAGIVSRILGQLLNEATWMVESGVAEPSDIDKAMKLGANHPMGPLQLIDFIGLDVHKAKMETLCKVLNDPRYQYPELIDRMIEQGKLGRKTGMGFYNYEGNK